MTLGPLKILSVEALFPTTGIILYLWFYLNEYSGIWAAIHQSSFSQSERHKYIAGLGLPITRVVSANQNATNNIPREKPEEWWLGMTNKLKHSNRTKDRWFPVKPLKNIKK